MIKVNKFGKWAIGIGFTTLAVYATVLIVRKNKVNELKEDHIGPPDDFGAYDTEYRMRDGKYYERAIGLKAWRKISEFSYLKAWEHALKISGALADKE